MIKNYCVIEVDSIEALREEVMELVRNGWIPSGGVSVTNVKNLNSEIDSWYAQAMIKTDSDIERADDVGEDKDL